MDRKIPPACSASLSSGLAEGEREVAKAHSSWGGRGAPQAVLVWVLTSYSTWCILAWFGVRHSGGKQEMGKAQEMSD